jgi:uncharacterized protein
VTPIDFLVAGVVTAVGSMIQGSIGFGVNVVAGPILVLIDPSLIPGPAVVCALLLTGLVAWRERKDMDLRALRWAFVGRIPATVIAAWAVSRLPERGVAIALGATVLGAVAISLGGFRFRPTPATLVGAGLASGVMGTIAAIGGPPMALVYQDEPGPKIRATLSGFFVVGALLSLGSLAAVGRFGTDELLASGVLVPGTLLGFWLSRWTGGLFDRGFIRPAVLGLCAVAAVGAIVHYV